MFKHGVNRCAGFDPIAEHGFSLFAPSGFSCFVRKDGGAFPSFRVMDAVNLAFFGLDVFHSVFREV